MLRLLACFLLLTTYCPADSRAVVALEVHGGGPLNFTMQRGSAVLVELPVAGCRRDGHYTLITASHCVTASQLELPGRAPIREDFPENVVIDLYLKDAWYPCSINSYSAKGDLALLEVACGEKLHAVRIATSRPDVDAAVTACGFMLGLDQHNLPSNVLNKDFFPTCDSLNCPTQCIVHGMSGGGVFNASGELCGVISSISPKTPWVSQYTHLDEITRFTKTFAPSPTPIGPQPAKPVVGDRAVPRLIGE